MGMEDQNHQALAFLGGSFAGSQKSWTAYENEAYAIVCTFNRLDYILWGLHPVHIFTGHSKQLFAFALLAFPPNSPRHILSKVHRCAIHLSRFEFSIDHVDGNTNVCADILSRWTKRHGTNEAISGIIAAMHIDVILSSNDVPRIDTKSSGKNKAHFHPPTCNEARRWSVEKRNFDLNP